ncbi:VHS domain-domain-containing protein [Lobosporangium transversale]|uniref:VHS domain-domain-containing protein n=1 Tax=Lobosporangium transversale TaxID=64571 RepID=A0A1Y2GRG7_9FUNG|nr:VHS domain-domain-containing protein [Lobosporangium transversale]ORZ20113.1 VHS domain-domain-containing protein [Lobosporangium transversale]|eukprot:XP_021882653.1 VHS domain-domain-containing protein [Lobosporangium transversale]
MRQTTPQQRSILEIYIERACDPSRYAPDLTLNLEICDVINEKQKNTPREAAIYIVRLVNHKNVHVGMLALALLDNCVKSCGYPFHLQIATKEFLNALVRKFPERPLTVPTPVQSRILELIQEWYMTLCKTSRYKEDLVHIRDMHRLLSFKGYRFPQARKTTMSPVEILKSPSELKAENRIAQAARLQELIRRGRPEDVRAANELVKKMTGYEREDEDYVTQASEGLNKVMQKAMLLIEMLNDVKPDGIIEQVDISKDLYETCRSALRKVQKFIKDGENHDIMETLLKLEHILISAIDQYDQAKNGSVVKVALTYPENSGDCIQNTSTSDEKHEHARATSKPTQSSVIDLLVCGDGPSNESSSTTSTKNTDSLIDDLMDLNFHDTPPPLSWRLTGSINLDQSSNILTTDVSPTSIDDNVTRSAFPMPVLGTHAAPLDDLEFISNTVSKNSGSIDVLLLNKSGLQIELEIEKQHAQQSDIAYNIKAYFSNLQSSPISALTFRVAVPKNLQLSLHPQSSQVVAPFSKRSVTQDMMIRVPHSVVMTRSAVRMRYHVSCTMSEMAMEEQGEFNQFP